MNNWKSDKKYIYNDLLLLFTRLQCYIYLPLDLDLADRLSHPTCKSVNTLLMKRCWCRKEGKLFWKIMKAHKFENNLEWSNLMACWKPKSALFQPNTTIYNVQPAGVSNVQVFWQCYIHQRSLVYYAWSNAQLKANICCYYYLHPSHLSQLHFKILLNHNGCPF